MASSASSFVKRIFVIFKRLQIRHDGFLLNIDQRIELQEYGVHPQPLTVAFPGRHQFGYLYPSVPDIHNPEVVASAFLSSWLV